MADSSYIYQSEEIDSSTKRLAPLIVSRFVATAAPLSIGSNVQVWNMVFQWLDPRSYAKIQYVCQSWKSTCMFYSIGMHVLENRIRNGMSKLTIIERASKNLRTSDYLPPDSNLAEYVAETAQDCRLNLHVALSRASELSMNPLFMMLMDLHVKQMELSAKYFESSTEVSEEADAREFQLRRSLTSMEKTFRLSSHKPSSERSGNKSEDASRIIADRDARQVWRTAMKRRKVGWISVKEFATHLKWPVEQVPILNIVIDYPQDGVITPFKWNSFVSLFGPYRSLKTNFTTFVLGGGFCGFISRSHAERLLTPLPPKIVLMRASRTHSSVMALTYRPSHNSDFIHLTNNSNFWTMPEFGAILNTISHQRGTISHSKNVPIDYFVEMFQRSGYFITGMNISSIDLNHFRDFDSLPTSSSAQRPEPSLPNLHTEQNKSGCRRYPDPCWTTSSDSSNNSYTSFSNSSDDATPSGPALKGGAGASISSAFPPVASSSNSDTATSSSNNLTMASYYVGDTPSGPPTAQSTPGFGIRPSPAPNSFGTNLSSVGIRSSSDLELISLTEMRIPPSNAPQQSHQNVIGPVSSLPKLSTEQGIRSTSQQVSEDMELEEELKELKKSLLNPNRRSRVVSYRLLLTRPPFLDCSQLERYLSEIEFATVFGMSKKEFEGLPYPKRKVLKQSANLG